MPHSDKIIPKENQCLQAKYDVTAWFYDILDYPWERQYRRWRAKLLKDVHGDVLEIGVGTGRNFKHYPQDVRLTGIDLSARMLARAKRRAKQASCSIDLHHDDATLMSSVASNHFDWVFATFACCVIPSEFHPLVLKQFTRVLKPSGRFRLLGMVYSKDRRIRKTQEFFAPYVEKIFGGRLDRSPLQAIEDEAHLEVTKTYFLKGDEYLVIEGRCK